MAAATSTTVSWCPGAQASERNRRALGVQLQRCHRHSFQVCSAELGLVVDAPTSDKVQSMDSAGGELLACPVCFNTLIRKGPAGLNQKAISRSAFQCPTCKRAYSNRDAYLDLTITSGSKAYAEVPPGGTQLFRNPLVSLVYERGWRQNFETRGFPGPDEELNMALKFMEPVFGGSLVDVSCGSGLFTRRFAKCGKFAVTVALDFSENMLRQSSEFIKQDKSLADLDIALVRADVARLPFSSSTIDAVHAGAALHCWPSPSAGVAEICRVLKPGGVFVGTTFLTSETFPLGWARSNGGMRYWKEPELEDLLRLCGLTDYQKIRRRSFIMLTARKPLNAS